MVLIINFMLTSVARGCDQGPFLSMKWQLIVAPCLSASQWSGCHAGNVILHTCIHRNSFFLNVTRFLLLNKLTKIRYASIVLHRNDYLCQVAVMVHHCLCFTDIQDVDSHHFRHRNELPDLLPDDATEVVVKKD